MKLNESKIKLIISRYQSTKDNDCIKLFQEETYHFIIQWARIHYHCCEDTARDFMIFMLDYTEQIMNFYPQDSVVLFKTWFIAVLVHKYADFFKKGSVNLTSSQSSFEIYEEDLPGTDEFNNQDSKVLHYDQLVNVVMGLPMQEQSFMFLYYLPREINSTHILAISEFTNKPLHLVLQYHQEILKIHESSFLNQEILKNKQEIIEHKMSHLNNMFLKTEDPVKKELLQNKIFYFKNRKYKMMLQLKQKNKLSMKVLADLFNNYDSAYRFIRKLETKIRRLSDLFCKD